MGICWYCHWGWSKPVMDIYNKALDKLEYESPMLFGPAHIVWEDENWDSVDWCIEHFDEYAEDLTNEAKEVVMWSLKELQKIPMEIRDPCPNDYDGENPELYPPKIEVVK